MNLSRRRKTLIVVATLIGTFLAALDSTVVGTAMPTIIGELGGLELYSWVFSVYLLAATVTGPIFGKLSDSFGRKPVYLAGISLFLLGSILSGTADGMVGLIFFRAIQGLGAGAVQPIAITIMGDIFELEARARIQGLFGAVWGISAVIGPATGGLLTDFVSWRWVFYVNVPFGIIAGILLFFALKEDFERRPGRPDYLGVSLLTGGLVALLFALLGGDVSVYMLVFLVVFGISALVAFVFVEARAEDPIVPLELFRNRLFSVASLGNLAAGGVLLGLSVYVPLYVQGALGGTAITAGAVVAPISIGWPVGSFIGGRLLLKVGYRPTLIIGGICLVAGTAMCLPLGANTPLAYVIASVFVVGLGLGFTSTSYLVAVQNSVPWNRRGIATSSVVFFRTVGGSIGVAVMGALLNFSLGGRYEDAVDRASGGDDGLQRLLSDPNTLLQPTVRERIPDAAYGELAASLAASLSPVFWVISAIGVCGLVASLLFPRGSAKELVNREE